MVYKNLDKKTYKKIFMKSFVPTIIIARLLSLLVSLFRKEGIIIAIMIARSAIIIALRAIMILKNNYCASLFSLIN